MIHPKQAIITLGCGSALVDSEYILRRFNSCLMCRKRKLKCDGVQPECSRCRTTGHRCEYQYPVSKTKTQQLQDRIQALESQIEAFRSRSKSSLAPIQSPNDLPDQTHTILLPANGSPYLDPYPPHASTFGSSRLSHACQLHSVSMRSGASSDLLSRLLGIFMQRRFQCGFELHIGRVLRSFQRDATEPLVAALFNAMLLVASHFTDDPDLKVWGPKFLERTKWEIETNITRAHGSVGSNGGYNALYHLQAMSLLGQYFYFCGRLLEGYVHMTQAVRFAVALGIHRLNSRIWHRSATTIKFKPEFGPDCHGWRPRDPIELGEAINVWWACAARDLAGSTLNGLPPAVSLDEITTVWPYPLSGFEDDRQLPDDNYSIASLLDPTTSYVIADASQGTVFCILCKASILMYTAGKLDVERMTSPHLTAQWWTSFEECSRTIDRFMQTVPPVCTGRNSEEVAFLAIIHTALECSAIQLHNAFAENELAICLRGGSGRLASEIPLGGDNYKRCVNACRNIAWATSQIEQLDMSYMLMFIGVTWVGAAGFLARQIPLLKQHGYDAQAREMEQQMMVMERGMERLLVVHPVLGLQAEKLRSFRTW